MYHQVTTEVVVMLIIPAASIMHHTHSFNYSSHKPQTTGEVQLLFHFAHEETEAYRE